MTTGTVGRYVFPKLGKRVAFTVDYDYGLERAAASRQWVGRSASLLHTTREGGHGRPAVLLAN